MIYKEDAVILPIIDEHKEKFNNFSLDTQNLIQQNIQINKFDNKNNIITVIGSAEAKILVLVKLNNNLRLLGSKIVALLKNKLFNNIVIMQNNISNPQLEEIILGFKLGNYSFNKYYSNLTDDQKMLPNKLIIDSNFRYDHIDAIVEGIVLARDLGNEPSNVLTPSNFVCQIQKLEKLGIKIEVLNKEQMKQINMNALLAVAKGSGELPFTVIMSWNGKDNSKSRPIAFAGKGVTFDSGGISIKPANKMEEMKFDMCGAATVVGLMYVLAKRKAQVNVVSAVGLVENMPSGTAQKPGDIVTSMSNLTIEVTNTDAEGRMVLADILYLLEKNYNPKFIIDLATLTGSVCVALGLDYAGLFSNNDQLADQIIDAGKKSQENIWRMPMDDCYDKLINSKIADVINSEPGRYAGSITAAHFLKRFIKKDTIWAHIDIAGTSSIENNANTLNPYGATGYGIMLLNQLVKDYYE